MTTVPHTNLQQMLDAFDQLIDASEEYQTFIAETTAQLERDGFPDAALNTWRRQHGWVGGFVEFLEDDVLERLRELVDRTAVMETAKRGDFV